MLLLINHSWTESCLLQHAILRHFTHMQKDVKILPSMSLLRICGLLDIQFSIDGNVHSVTTEHVHIYDRMLTSM